MKIFKNNFKKIIFFAFIILLLTASFFYKSNVGTTSDLKHKSEKETATTNSDKEKDSDDSDNVCTILISCETILDNMDSFNMAKKEVLPEDGIILSKTEVEIKKDDSVYDILKRVCKDNDILLEASDSLTYNTVYIEGINNIYEFDCGPTSGWMYTVNGVFINEGCSNCTVNPGDEIEWKYTCSLGKDVGEE